MYLFVCCTIVFVFFFFKQKTAYEMRISDWSSDVCSSDLLLRHPHPRGAGDRRRDRGDQIYRPRPGPRARAVARRDRKGPEGPQLQAQDERAGAGHDPPHRSEEHTSELQSLMRISYAVFCVKKK